MKSFIKFLNTKSTLIAARFFCYFCKCLIIFSVIFYATKKMDSEAEFERSMAEVEVEMEPTWLPEHNQASIDLAIAAFSIDVPSTAADPKLNLEISDRGITFKRAIDEFFQVEIGPAAFSSWSLLGSTLAHELEVHCNQDFLAIYFLDVLGFDGTAMAERSAYAYELQHAQYFRLSALEKLSILETKEDFYPLTQNGPETPMMNSQISKIELGELIGLLRLKFTTQIQQFFARNDDVTRVSSEKSTRTL